MIRGFSTSIRLTHTAGVPSIVSIATHYGSRYGVNLSDKTSIKANAAELLDKQLFLRARKNQFGIIVMSSATDPYLHFEHDLKLTRKLLGIIQKHKFPVHIITKSDLVLRDLDILRSIETTAILPRDLFGRVPGAIITFSFSTLDDKINAIFEPGAVLPTQRLEALKHVTKEKFISGVSLMPLIPYITDTGDSLCTMYRSFATAGASYIMPSSLYLPGNP